MEITSYVNIQYGSEKKWVNSRDKICTDGKELKTSDITETNSKNQVVACKRDQTIVCGWLFVQLVE